MADDIEQTRKEEERRGRRPIDSETIKQRQRTIVALRRILADGTVDELKDAMRVYGLSPDSPQWIETLRIWHEERE